MAIVVRTPISEVYRTKFERPYGGGVKTCAYVVKTATGVVVIGGSKQFERYSKIFNKLGKPDLLLYSHSHEATASGGWLRQMYGSKIVCHEEEQREISRIVPVDLLFADRKHLGDCIEAIHTPGHTLGSCCYKLSLPDGMRCLFSGDTLYSRGGALSVAFEECHRSKMIDTLTMLRAETVDFIVPSLFVGKFTIFNFSNESQLRCFDSVIGRLRQNLSH